MRRGFTLIEILTCIAIVAVVAAITYPVFVRVKHAAAVQKSISNLHQMHLALKLYQMSDGGDGRYGSLVNMGLPERLIQPGVGVRFDTPEELWRSPCGQNPSWHEQPVVIQYDYHPEVGLDQFEIISPVYQENLIMFSDMNCAEHGEPVRSEFIPHRILGVLLSGTLVNNYKPGDPRFQKWWTVPAVD